MYRDGELINSRNLTDIEAIVSISSTSNAHKKQSDLARSFIEFFEYIANSTLKLKQTGTSSLKKFAAKSASQCTCLLTSCQIFLNNDMLFETED
jgi:hypothetical protein